MQGTQRQAPASAASGVERIVDLVCFNFKGPRTQIMGL